MSDAVIFDVDGTLCDVTSIRHHVDLHDPRHERIDFDAFHRASVDCPPHQHVIDAVHQAHDDGQVVIIVTARQTKYRALTEWWLSEQAIEWDYLLMRATGDWRTDVDVKRDILTRIRRKHHVVMAWDDNPSIIQLWESKGIPVTVVPGWPEYKEAT